MKNESQQPTAIIERAVAHIEKNIGNRTLSDASIARAAGTNVPTLIVMFQTVFGRSVWEFVMGRRLEHVKRMIENERSKPINDIALEVGIDPKYFSDFFHA